MRRSLIALAACAVASSAAAQAPQRQTIDPTAPGAVTLSPAQSDGESTVVDELEVVAHQRGPAMWTVTKGDADVVVIGAYSPLPHSLDWDKTRLERVLQGARALYVPQAQIGLISGAGILLTMGSLKLTDGGQLSDAVGAERMRRLQAYAERSRQPLDRYRRLKPGAAGYMLYGDFARAAGFSLEKPRTTIEREARAAHVPVRPLAKVSIASLIRTVEKLDPPRQLACFDAYMATLDAVSERGAAAANAWANGRLSELRKLAAPSPDRVCLPSGVDGRSIVGKGIADAVSALEEALRTPGHSVAVVPMGFLLPANGVLDRLKTAGAEITVPPG